MLNIIGAEHRGKQVVRDIYGKTAGDQFKSFISYWAFKVVYLGAVSAFVFAGFMSALVVIGVAQIA